MRTKEFFLKKEYKEEQIKAKILRGSSVSNQESKEKKRWQRTHTRKKYLERDKEKEMWRIIEAKIVPNRESST